MTSAPGASVLYLDNNGVAFSTILFWVLDIDGNLEKFPGFPGLLKGFKTVVVKQTQ